MSGPFGRNLGLVVALLLICAAGVITAGDRFASIDNILTILRFASTIGVVSIGMTFVITGGGIDLSVGAIAGALLGVGDDVRHADDGRGHPLDRSWCSSRWPSAPDAGSSTAC